MKLLKTIFDTAIKFGEKFSKLTSIGQLATIGILMYSTYYVTSCSNNETVDGINVIVEETKEYSNKLKDSVITLHDSVRGKEVVIKKLTVQVSLLSKQRNVLQNDQRRLEDLRNVTQDTTIIIALQDTTIDNLKTQLAVTDTVVKKQEQIINNKTQQISLLETSLSLSEQRSDTLEKTLDRTLDKLNKKDKLWGVIPLPNRKVVAATALVGGVYLGTQIKK